MDKKCMVTGCQEEGTHFSFDGVFWIKVCNQHLSEFRNFAQDNNLKFEVRDICLYCGLRICKESVEWRIAGMEYLKSIIKDPKDVPNLKLRSKKKC